MRTMLKSALAAVALSASVLPVTPASALSFADCPWGQVTGNATYAPALTMPPPPTTPVNWTITMTANCFGSSPAAGTYNLVLTGTSTETCVSGTATGTISGTGPNGTVIGTTGYQRFGIHLYGFPPYASSTFSSGGKAYTLAIWLDIYGGAQGVTTPVCPLAAGTMIGHAAVTEL